MGSIWKEEKVLESGVVRPKILRVTHISYALQAMLRLFEDPAKLIKDTGDLKSARANVEFADLVDSILVKDKDKASVGGWHRETMENFLLLACLYHDIGVAIHVEKHNSEGYHLLSDFRPEELTKLEKIIDDPDLAALFRALILHHTKYGISSTGEASLPFFISVINLATGDPEKHKAALSYLGC